jgi:uncharacterized membrane protein
VTARVDNEFQSRLSLAVRALGLLAAGGLSLGLALGVAFTPLSVRRYFLENYLDSTLRHRLLAFVLGGTLVAVAAGAGYLLSSLDRPGVVLRLHHVARRLAPLYLVGFLALLFRVDAWRGHDLPFLALVAIFGLCAAAAVKTALSAGPLAGEERLGGHLLTLRRNLGLALPRLWPRLPFVIVALAAAGYAVYFAYYTYCFYYSLRSGYDLGIYDSLLWNMLHGGSFFKTPPWAGPGRSHFGNHAEFFAYMLVPLYAIRQNGGTLLIIQSVILGSAAIPLYKLARRHIGPWPACLLALVYLIYPALHGENLFEFHFLPLGPFLLWWAWYFLEARRNWWAALFVLFTLSCREDVSSWVAVLGAYLLFSGRRPKAGLLLAVIGTTYCFVLKFWAMPYVGGGESFTDIYKDLLPTGAKSFGSVVATLLGNPAYTAHTLAEMSKLIFMLQILLPLALLPFRRPIWLILAIPGFFFTVLSTRYSPLISINFQYSAHWIAFFFPGVAIALDWMSQRAASRTLAVRARRTALATMVAMSLPISYQYGAIFQQTNSYGGPIKYVFGVNAEGQRRHDAAERLRRHLPPLAKVTASGFTTPYLSNRPDAYNMTISATQDSDYIFFPSVAAEFIGDEKKIVTEVLRNKDYGVVAIEPPFALAKKGHATDLNERVMRAW